MGGGVSASLWSLEEQEENKKATEIQKLAQDFITKEIYSGIPIRSIKKSHDPKAPVFMEPLPEVFEESLQKSGSVLDELIRTVPTGVRIDGKGNLKIMFSLTDISYTIRSEELLAHLGPSAEASMAIGNNATNKIDSQSSDVKSGGNISIAKLDPLPDPGPPKISNATKTSLLLSWGGTNVIPKPAGIVHAVEVQYLPLISVDHRNYCFRSHTAFRAHRTKIKLTDINTSFDSEDESSDSDNSTSEDSDNGGEVKWNALVSKSYFQTGFLSYEWMGLRPGSLYRFRMRYRTHAGWSDFSRSSPIIRTLPDRPAAPLAPICSAITSNCVELQWDKFPASRENGSEVYEMVLWGRSVGHDEFTELYRGLHTSYLALGLFPEFAYSFKLAAINGLGQSEFSPLVSVQTPPKQQVRRNQTEIEAVYRERGEHSLAAYAAVSGLQMDQIEAAHRCRDAWREYWDPQTEQSFYFNTILATRQLVTPEVLLLDKNDTADDDNILPESNSSNRSSVGNAENLTNMRSIKLAGERREIELGKLFRKKRYRLLHALRKLQRTSLSNSPSRLGNSSPSQSPISNALRQNRAPVDNNLDATDLTQLDFYEPVPYSETVASAITESTLDGVSSSGTSTRSTNKSLKLKLNRKSMLADCYKIISRVPCDNLRSQRIHVSFDNEEGIDSGGPSKEAFLLISKQAAIFAGPVYKKWLRSIIGSCHDDSKVNKKEKISNKKAQASSDADQSSKLKFSTDLWKDLVTTWEGYFFATDNSNNSPSDTDNHDRMSTNDQADPGAGTREGSQLQEILESITELDAKLKVKADSFFHFLGRFFGKALYDRQLIDFPLSTLLLTHMIGGFNQEFLNSSNENKNSKESAARMLAQIEYCEPELFKSLTWIFENNITDIIFETFSVMDGDKEVPLCSRGEETDVTENNKYEYIRLIILWKIVYSIQDNLKAFLGGFHEIVPLTVLQNCGLNIRELNLILNGKREVDVEEIRAFCIYQSDDVFFNESHPSVEWLWRAVREFDDHDRRALLLFFTGSSRVPLDGYDPALNITQGVDMALNSLPRAHTCFNQLVLPRYASYEVFVDKLKFAIHNTGSFELS